MANMVFRMIWLLVTVWVSSINGHIGLFPFIRTPLFPNTYYTIVDIDGNNLGVDLADYRKNIEIWEKEEATAVVTLPTNGDYEKWSIVENITGKFNIINKATGLYLTASKRSSWPTLMDRGYEYSIKQQTEEDHKRARNLQRFNLEPKDFFSEYYRISHGEEYHDGTSSKHFLTSLETPTLDVPQTPLHEIISFVKHPRAVWRFQPTQCDPHPNQLYQIVHYLSGRYLTSFISDAIVAVDLKDAIRSDTTFRFVPTKFDKKVYYIQNPETGRVIAAGRSKSYGTPLEYDVKNKTEQNLYQHWYILPSPDGRKCIFGSIASYRYFGPNDNTYVVQKEQTATLDEYWYLKGLKYE